MPFLGKGPGGPGPGPPTQGGPPHSRVYLFLSIFIAFLSYIFSKIAKNAKFCPENRKSSPCSSFLPHFWLNVPVLSPPPSRIIEDSFREPPNNCGIVLGGPPQGLGPRAPKLLKMALLSILFLIVRMRLYATLCVLVFKHPVRQKPLSYFLDCLFGDDFIAKLSSSSYWALLHLT